MINFLRSLSRPSAIVMNFQRQDFQFIAACDSFDGGSANRAAEGLEIGNRPVKLALRAETGGIDPLDVEL